jgi:hypothetical protein
MMLAETYVSIPNWWLYVGGPIATVLYVLLLLFLTRRGKKR